MTFKFNPSTNTLPERLKTETQANHQKVEKLLMTKIRCVKDISDYIRLLGVFYGYFGAAEELLGPFIGNDSLQDFHLRRKAENIKNDISFFNGRVPHFAHPDELPGISNSLQAFGMLYVLEGSTLGGSIISKVIQKQLDLSGAQGFTFFNGYGGDTETMWANFKKALATLASGDAECEVVIASADQTFSGFGKWIEKSYSSAYKEY